MNKLKTMIVVVLVCLMLPIALYANEEKPVALFSFEKESYQVDEPIKVKEGSYSPKGLKITQKEWKRIVDGEYKKANNISTLLKNVQPGIIEVFLRAKDAEGTWSEWISRKIEVKETQVLEITDFKLEQTLYDIGEKLNFVFELNNPNDLTIKSQRWRYKNVTTGGSLVMSKPRYFNKAGTYEISLEIQDEWGNWSNKASCTVEVSNEMIKRNGSYLFNRGKPGDLIEDYIDKDYNTFDVLEDIEVQDVPGTLIVSNSPEVVSSSGILYQDVSKGIGRLVVHHLNNTSVTKKLIVVATTNGDQPVEVKVKDYAIQQPHKNILKMGQEAVKQFFVGNKEEVYTVKPGELTCIYDSSTIKGWEKDEVISGTFDFESDEEVVWTVYTVDVATPIEYVSMLKPLERDGHIRGTFDVIERNYTVNIKDLDTYGKIVLGGQADEWLAGYDALTGETTLNRGNYGLPIKIQLTSSEDMGIILNARGGGYLGSIKWNTETIFDVPNEEVLNSKKVAALIGKAKANKSVEWTYMLPNGSAAPVLFGFIPSHLWE
ncbi:hypothetical protein [Niameybacter massiliensis]|uniref:hypothetical protein n=1 Tax=Niameybacter massiliensis TaxID=1658108 RepID=UPI0006B48E64|nr:hypothetical protein [Niameybacter massiliensis]